MPGLVQHIEADDRPSGVGRGGQGRIVGQAEVEPKPHHRRPVEAGGVIFTGLCSCHFCHDRISERSRRDLRKHTLLKSLTGNAIFSDRDTKFRFLGLISYDIVTYTADR